MPTYQLQLTFREADDGTAQLPDWQAIEDEMDIQAIAWAKVIMHDTYTELLQSAILHNATGSVVWALRRPELG